MICNQTLMLQYWYYSDNFIPPVPNPTQTTHKNTHTHDRRTPTQTHKAHTQTHFEFSKPFGHLTLWALAGNLGPDKVPTNFLRMCSSSFGSTSKLLYFVRFALVRPCRTCRIQSIVFVFLLLDCQDENMQTLPHLWTVTIKRCKHYMIFGLPRSIKANTTTLLDCQDQKKQTLLHFWTAKIRKCKH